MNKVVAFLEKHVQWIALGLGGLYLGYMIWTFAIQTPVVVTGIAPTPLTPGEVDSYILRTAVTPLEGAMTSTNVPVMDVPNFIDQFKTDMDFSNFKLFTFDPLVDSQVYKIQLQSMAKIQSTPDQPITALPTLPPATFAATSMGRSNVQPFGAAAGNPAPPAPDGNVVQPVAGAADKCWVTVGFKISPGDLAKAFKAVHIPAWTEKTTVLQVQLFREEALPGGKWSDPVPMAPLNAQLLLPFPAQNDNVAQQSFVTWAQQHVSDILQPAFYQVNKGDPWRAPGQVLVVALPAALTPLDPAKTYPLNVLRQYPDDQRKSYFLAHNKLKPTQPRPAGRAPSAPAAPSGSPDGSPSTTGRLNPSFTRLGAEIFADLQVPLDDAMPPPGGGPNNGPASASTLPPAVAALFPIPPGDFDPNAVTTDITGWAHDDTAQPGHTYRYMVQYTIKNPIFGAGNARINPALAAVFSIQSPLGQWSPPINVASTTNFFVYANSRPGAPTARFKVYKWQNGVERSKVFEVAPGDIIGGKDGDVDFNSGWTVVDLRFDDPHNPDSMTILVMDPTGILARRDYKTDQAKPERTALDQQVSAIAPTDQLANKP
jgi:hypothetical protein